MDNKDSLQASSNALFNYRIWLSRDGFSRYLSQHDTAAILEQSIRRASIPIAFSGQFNPRMRISYYTSLPVGIASSGEPIDLTLQKSFDVEELKTRLQNKLPSGFGISKVELFSRREKCWINLTYQVKSSFHISDEKIVQLLQKNEIWVIRAHNGKRVNIRQYILDCRLIANETNFSILEFSFRMDSTGSASVWELLTELEVPLNDQIFLDIVRTSVKLVPLEP